MTRVALITLVLLAAAPAIASQNGTLYGSCGNPGVNCGPHVTFDLNPVCDGSCMVYRHPIGIVPPSPDRWCFREDLGTELFDNAAPGETKPKLGPERCFVRTR